MIKVFYVFSLLITFFALRTVKAQEPLSVSLTPSPSIALPRNGVPPLALSWKANLHLVNFNKGQEEKMREAISLIKKVITSQEFRERVLNYRSKGGRTFVENQGLSNEEIYLKILEGAEQIGHTSKNNMMDVELELYHQKTNTIGYTYPHTSRIWINKKYFSRFTPIKVADNLMHEWMHKLGFTHAMDWSKERDHSVPYAIGLMVEELASRMVD
jgi:hypothetical protein